MSGNEVGDKVHNLFGQDKHGQHHPQVIKGNWPHMSNNAWVENQGHIGSPYNSNLKNYNVQQSDVEKGDGSQSYYTPHGLTHSNQKPELSRLQSQNQQQVANGFVHGHQVFQTRQNETNFLGVDTESNRHNLTSRGLSAIESQEGIGSEQNKFFSRRVETFESPVSYDFFGGQQHMSSQQLGMLQSLPRQQPGISDMHLLQRRVMLAQMQEFNRQEQLQQLEARQQSFTNQVSSTAKQGASNHSPSLINGVPINEAPNQSWSLELMAGNPNWIQPAASSAMQGPSAGHMSAEQGQALQMGLVPQQMDQSLYGVPLSSHSGTHGPYPNMQMDKMPMQQIPANGSSFLGNAYATLSDKVGLQGGSKVSKVDSQRKNMFESGSGQSMSTGPNFENLHQSNHLQRSASLQEFQSIQEVAGSSQSSQGKVLQVASSPSVATLDPTEEKILFGSEDNIQYAFGRSIDVAMGSCNMLDDTDSFSGYPLVQSGTWSALMQSAVAETSSADVGMQEYLSGHHFQSPEPLTMNRQPPTVNDGSEQVLWADNNMQLAPALNTRQYALSDDANKPHSTMNSNSIPEIQQQSISSYDNDGQPYNRSNGWNFMGSMPTDNNNIFKSHENKSISIPFQTGDGKLGMHGKMDQLSGVWRTDSTLTSNAGFEHVRSSAESPLLGRESSNMSNVVEPNPSAGRSNQENKQFSKSHKLDLWKSVDPSVKSGGEVNQNQHNFDRSPQILESSLDTGLGKGAVQVYQQLENSDSKENSSEGRGHHHRSTGVMRENVWSDAGDSRSYHGSNQKSLRNAGRRPPETSHGAKHTAYPQTMAQQRSRGLKGHEKISYGQSTLVGHTDRTTIEMGQQGQAAGSQGDIKGSEGTLSKSVFPSFMPNASATSDRSIGNYTPNKAMPSSQNMLELLHKVDHSSEHGTATPLSSSDRITSEMHEPEASDGSVGHVQHNHSSGSRGFGLQLGPPSQRPPITDHVLSYQRSMPRFFNSTDVTHEIGVKGNSKLDSVARDEIFPSCKPSEEIRNDASGTSGRIESKTSQFNVQGSSSPAILSGFPFSKNSGNLHATVASRQVPANQSITMPSESFSSRSKVIDDSYERAQVYQFVPTSVASLSGSTTQKIVYSSAEVSKLNISNQDCSREPSRWTLEQDEAPVTLPSFAHGSSQHGDVSKVLPNARNSVPFQQPLLVAQPSNTISNLFRSHENKLLTTLPGLPRVNEQDTLEEKSGLSQFGAIPANLQSCARLEQPAKERHGQQVSFESLDPVEKTSSVSQGRESVVNHFSEGSTSNTSTTQRDIEAFGRSLRSNNSLHQNYSLLHQVQAMKSTEVKAGDRNAKRLKGPEYVVQHPQVGPKGEQQPRYGYNSTVRDSSVNPLLTPSEDSERTSFSSKPVESRDSNALSQNGPFSQNSSHNLPGSSNILSIRREPYQISPLMASSWFDQYGTFKNGQMLPAYDLQNQRPSTLNLMEQPFKVGRLADDLHARSLVEQGNVTDGCKPGDVPHSSTPTKAANVHANSPHLMPPDLTDQSLAVRPKKRKAAAPELLPWHKELTEASQSVRTISITESDWAQATNRLVEKLEDDDEMSMDAPSMLRSKRRLILTTQLVQQLLCCPPVTCLCKDASSECQSVAYFAARLALGDACSAITCFGSLPPHDSERRLSEKPKMPEKVSEQCSKVVEDFIGRIRKLESDFLRLDKRTSVLDLRVDCQDLEKFSVINRFAKFHGRGQNDGADTSSSSDTTPNVQKACPQKYVTGFPMPRNLPDRVHCLSL